MKLILKKIYLFIKKIKRDIDDYAVPDNFKYNVDIDSNIVNIEIPMNIKRIRLDIGLSHNAPNSAEWLKDEVDLQVIGVEANVYNIHQILKKGNWSNSSKKVKPFKTKNLSLLYCALDDVHKPTYSKFYNIRGDSGTSSLLQPTKVLLDSYSYSVKSITLVPTISLDMLMNNVPWERFEYIELCKIDTQGKDLDILKSAKNYLNKIALILAEVDTFGQYNGAASRDDIYKFMEKSNFDRIKTIRDLDNQVADVLFLNRNFINNEYVNNLINKIL